MDKGGLREISVSFQSRSVFKALRLFVFLMPIKDINLRTEYFFTSCTSTDTRIGIDVQFI